MVIEKLPALFHWLFRFLDCQFYVKKILNFWGSETYPNFQFLGVMLTAWSCVVDKIKINNEINRLHKSTYKELLEKDW